MVNKVKVLHSDRH